MSVAWRVVRCAEVGQIRNDVFASRKTPEISITYKVQAIGMNREFLIAYDGKKIGYKHLMDRACAVMGQAVFDAAIKAICEDFHAVKSGNLS